MWRVSNSSVQHLREHNNQTILDGGQGSHFGFPIRIILTNFALQVNSMLPIMFRVNKYFGSVENVQHGGYGDHLGFPIGTILATCHLQVTPTLFWSFKSTVFFFVQAVNRFSRWQLRQPSWISDRNNFNYFWSNSPRYFPLSFESVVISA